MTLTMTAQTMRQSLKELVALLQSQIERQKSKRLRLLQKLEPASLVAKNDIILVYILLA